MPMLIIIDPVQDSTKDVTVISQQASLEPAVEPAVDIYKDFLAVNEIGTNMEQSEATMNVSESPTPDSPDMGTETGSSSSGSSSSYSLSPLRINIDEGVKKGLKDGENKTNGPKYNLFVGNLNWWTSDEDLDATLRGIGVEDLLRLRIIENRNNGQSKGICCVTLGSEASVKLVFDLLPKTQIGDNFPTVSRVNPEVQMFSGRRDKPLPNPQQTMTPMMNPGQRMGPNSPMRPQFGGPGMQHPMRPNGCPPRRFPPPRFNGQRPCFGFQNGGMPFGPSHPQPPMGNFRGPSFGPPQAVHEGNMAHGNYMSPNQGPALMRSWNYHGAPPSSENTMSHPQQMIRAPHVNPPFYNPQNPQGSMISGPPVSTYGGFNSGTNMNGAVNVGAPNDHAEILSRNQVVSSAAIRRAVEEAASGDFENAIETLVTAISLIRNSRIGETVDCQTLIDSLECALGGIMSQKREKPARRARTADRDSSVSSVGRQRSRSRSPYYSRSRIREHRRECSRTPSRERGYRRHFDDSNDRRSRAQSFSGGGRFHERREGISRVEDDRDDAEEEDLDPATLRATRR